VEAECSCLRDTCGPCVACEGLKSPLPCRPRELDEIGLRHNKTRCAGRASLRAAHHTTQNTTTTKRRNLRKSFWVGPREDLLARSYTGRSCSTSCEVCHVRELEKGVVRNLSTLVVRGRASQRRLQLSLGLKFDEGSVLRRRTSRHCFSRRRLSVRQQPRPLSFLWVPQQP